MVIQELYEILLKNLKAKTRVLSISLIRLARNYLKFICRSLNPLAHRACDGVKSLL